MNSVVPIIPSLEPDNKLTLLVNNLVAAGYKKILVVDDGSKDKRIFNKLGRKKEVVILTHERNKGKGEALKTAFRYYKRYLTKKHIGVICLDSDGQHKTNDVLNISKILCKEDKFILGTRLFNTRSTPLRNKFGNRLTSMLFKMIYKVYIKDTQTGLRAIPNRLIDMHLNTSGSRFEYELNVLINLIKLNEEIKEVDIKTVYLEDSNKHSHFDPIKDSYRVYKVLFGGKRNI